jgi:signal transduction histidine kinase
MSSSINSDKILKIPAIIGFVAVSVSSLTDLRAGNAPYPAIVLLAIFGLAYLLPSSLYQSSVFAHLRVGVAVAAVSGLMAIRPGWSEYPILLFLLCPQIMLMFSTPTSLKWIGLAALATLIIFVAALGLAGILPFLLYASGYIFFAVFGWLLIQSENNRKKAETLFTELQQAHQQLQNYASRVEALTIAEERNRIAREMHDSLGHRLTITAVQLEGAQRLVRTNPERSEQIIATVREQVRDGLKDLRRTVAMLRASAEEDLAIQPALQQLVQQMKETTGINIALVCEETLPDLPAPYRLALYRAAQEGLTNIQRHARASQAWLQLYAKDQQIVLLVSDNGLGLDPHVSSTSFGLAGLRERASLLGGKLMIDPRPGGGTQLTFYLPIPQTNPE